jgi:hypothetical protein
MGAPKSPVFSRDGTYWATFDTSHWTLQFWLPKGTKSEREVALEGKTPAPARFGFMVMSPAQQLA